MRGLKTLVLLGGVTTSLSAQLSAGAIPESTILDETRSSRAIDSRLRPQDLHRQLQETPCDSSLGTILSSDVLAMGDSFLKSILPASEYTEFGAQTSRVLFQTIQYDLVAMKLCTSCEDIADWYYRQGTLVLSMNIFVQQLSPAS
jgi:hypothetical protein